MSDPHLYYIIDTRTVVGNCAMFWGPNRSGYVCNLAEAGKYSEEDAKHQQRSRPTDVAVPCDVIDAMAVTHVRADTRPYWDALAAAKKEQP